MTKGDDLYLEANNIIAKSSSLLLRIFGNSENKFELAADLFKRSAIAFKLEKNYSKAAISYINAAESFSKANAVCNDIFDSYAEAGRCYIKAGLVEEGINIMRDDAIPRIIEASCLIKAAKLYTEMADICSESDIINAIKYFEEASKYYQIENATTSYIDSLVQVATLSAKLEPLNYNRSIEIFSSIGKEVVDNQNLKYKAGEYFFNCIILILAKGDIVCASKSLEEFSNVYYPFTNSREYKLLEDIICAYSDNNVDAFTDSIYNYDQISRLNPWRTTLLLTIKNNIGINEISIL